MRVKVGFGPRPVTHWIAGSGGDNFKEVILEGFSAYR